MLCGNWFMVIYNSLWVFVLFAFLGWVVEVVYSLYDDKKLVNRGFLLGPVCPIYGFAVLLISVCLSPLVGHPFLLFICSTVLVSLLELATGVVLEQLFKQKWWDYSCRRFNFRGYICLKFSLIWGLLCLFVIYFLLPFLLHVIALLPIFTGSILLAVTLLIMAVDFFFTVCSIAQVRNYLSNIKSHPHKISVKIKRLAKAFSNLKSIEISFKDTKQIDDSQDK